MILREEQLGDREAVHQLISSAFGQPDEADLVRALQRAGDAVLSLVAEVEGGLAGHVLLSKMTAPFPALALAPVSVAPARQRRGIGSVLILEALHRARGQGWAAVFVLGDTGYYGRFGFTTEAAKGFSSPYAGEHFMALVLQPPLPATTGELVHAPAFAALG